MLISLVAVFTVVAAQAPALPAPQGPLSVLVAPPDATGAPTHVVNFAREHVTEQLEARGVRVIRMENVTRKMSATKRRALLRCKRTEAPCIEWLGTASQAEVVLITELTRTPQGYRAGVKTYATQNGVLISEHTVSDVLDDRLLDALTQTLDVVLPATQRALRPLPPPPRIDDVPPPTRVTRPPTGTSEPGTSTAPVPQAPVLAQTSSARRWAWLPAAGGVVLAGVGTVFYLKAKDRYDTLETGGSDLPLRDSDALVSQGKNAQTVSRVAFGLGAAGLAAGAVMFLWPEDDPSAKVVPSAAVTSGGAMVGLSGTWP